jgi:hypothetical protein
MYKAFKEELERASSKSLPLEDLDVSECWRTIYKQCQQYQEKASSSINPSGWKIIRLFVSSTFTDFHCEREVLVKRVSPAM